MHSSSGHLIFHGSIVLFFGLLLGAPYARAIKAGVAAHIVNSWRVAHLSLPIGATLMFAVASLLPSLLVATPVKWCISVALITSAYGFCVSTSLAAITGERGLGSGGSSLSKLVYAANMVGAFSSVVASAVLVFAAYVSLI